MQIRPEHRSLTAILPATAGGRQGLVTSLLKYDNGRQHTVRDGLDETENSGVGSSIPPPTNSLPVIPRRRAPVIPGSGAWTLIAKGPGNWSVAAEAVRATRKSR